MRCLCPRPVRRRPLMSTTRACGGTEKSSWLGLAKSSTGSGQWRPARCKLVEEEEGCLLNIYVDVSRPEPAVYSVYALTRWSQDTILYRSIYMYLLNHTDIRVVHRSLFEKKNCLAIFSVAYVYPHRYALPVCATH